eukprot:gene5727-7123_t
MDAFQKIHPLEFYRKFLEKSVRPDGRSLENIRKTTVSTGSITTADGSSFVKIGNTSVVCGIKAEVGPAHTDSDNFNNQQTITSNIFVNVELGPICSNTFSSTKPSEKAMTLCSHLNSLVKRLMIPNSDFYFDEKEEDFDGNLFDACVISMLAALKNVRLPFGIFEDGEYYKDKTKPFKSLNINHYLIPLSFSIIDEYILSDPSLEEEKLSIGSISITFNQDFEICLLYYSGINSISDENLKYCIEKAKERSQTIKSLIDSSIKIN